MKNSLTANSVYKRQYEYAKTAFEKGKTSNWFTIFYKSTFKFFRDYVLKLGFLDGYHGYVVCKNSAHAKRLKYMKLRNLNRKE